MENKIKLDDLKPTMKRIFPQSIISDSKTTPILPPLGRVFGQMLMSDSKPSPPKKYDLTTLIGRVKTLRQRTGLGIGECKKALKEANDDMELAEEILKIPRPIYCRNYRR